jgi:Spy/CpxP family protein refolding chaperone
VSKNCPPNTQTRFEHDNHRVTPRRQSPRRAANESRRRSRRPRFEASTQALHEQLRQAGPGGGGGPFEGLKDGAFDEAAVRAAAQARASLHVELEVARARMMSQVYALLTAEQKATLAERRQQFEQRRRARESKTGEAPSGK